ncbi:MAG: Ppx/GppA family phosphatase [Candidatus Symbiobacter sp.]|nr:Ppx/GppA family phosphatase [Candidatus Symbiobacter sp.]
MTPMMPPSARFAPPLFAPLSGRRVAVIDIGSNSMRLVVYHHPVRTPLVLFNEKITCQLGQALEHSGALNPAGVVLALPQLQRYQQITAAMGVEHVMVVATAAVREASDGPEFVARIEALTGWQVQILSGQQEAELVAMGLIAADIDAEGMVGDLGGGSLELIQLHQAGGAPRVPQLGAMVSLNLGLLRLRDQAGGKLELAEKIIDDALVAAATDSALAARKGGKFYAIGGAWRSIARLLMDQENYRLRVIHQYRCLARHSLDFLAFLRKLPPGQLAHLPNLSANRAELTPLAALVLERILRWCDAEEVIFSTAGLREGCLYASLSPEEQQKDPLLTACHTLVTARRFGLDGSELSQFMADLFASQGRQTVRLAEAAAIISDIAWAEHPDDRAEWAWRRVLYMPVIGLNHSERVFLARAIYARYRGVAALPPGLDGILPHIGAEWGQLAQQIGLALALGYGLSGGDAAILAAARLQINGGHLELSLPHPLALQTQHIIAKKLNLLAESLGLSPDLRLLPAR